MQHMFETKPYNMLFQIRLTEQYWGLAPIFHGILGNHTRGSRADATASYSRSRCHPVSSRWDLLAAAFGGPARRGFPQP
jgi:hypothetical protein